MKNTEYKDLVIVPKADHLFDEEDGLIEKVADITKQWFAKNLIEYR